MYNASNAFHTAIQQNAPQRALLIFDDAFFTNEDINVETGIDFDDYFNEETDLAIGQALSNQIRFTLYNDEGLLDNYTFGTFAATIGAKISESGYKQRAYVMAHGASSWYYGSNVYPYLTRNGVTMSVTFPVRSIFILDDTVHVFGDVGYYAAFSDSTGAAKSSAANAFMMHKASRMNAVGMYYSSASRTMREYLGGVMSTYEFVPLGVFTAVRPNVGTVIEIDFTCNDRMQLFDRDMPEDLTISYPITLKGLLDALCAYVGVQNGAATFLNSTAEIEKEPEAMKKATMRKVIGWIAEAACANARFDRDGVLQLDWIKSTSQTYAEGQYAEFNPYWYTVPAVGKLYNRDTSNALENVQGAGANGYLIQDNPLIALKKEDFAITAQPQTQTVSAGTTVTFVTAATGGDVEYQWQKKISGDDWEDVTGATSTSYAVAASAQTDGDRYRCKITLGNKTKYTDGASVLLEQPQGGGE